MTQRLPADPFSRGLVAIAEEASVKTDPGQVVLFDAQTLTFRGRVTVGALPDMLTFSDQGKVLLVSNEVSQALGVFEIRGGSED